MVLVLLPIVQQVAESKEAEEASKGGKPSEEETAAAVAAALKEGQSPELAAMLAVDSSRAYTAAIRVQVGAGRGLGPLREASWV